MARVKFLGFYLSVITFLFAGYSIYSAITNSWFVPNQNYILLLLSGVSFICGLIGLNNKKRAKSIITLMVSVVTVLCVTVVIIFTSIFSIEKEFLESSTSPTGKYKIDFYTIDGGATTTYGIIGELDGFLFFKKKVYVEQDNNKINIEWVDEDVISINNNLVDLR